MKRALAGVLSLLAILTLGYLFHVAKEIEHQSTVEEAKHQSVRFSASRRPQPERCRASEAVLPASHRLLPLEARYQYLNAPHPNSTPLFSRPSATATAANRKTTMAVEAIAGE